MVIIEYRNQQIIKGLEDNEVVIVKDALTFDNPAYLNAKKYGRSPFISIPPYLTYYEYGKISKGLKVPIGFDLLSLLREKLSPEEYTAFSERGITIKDYRHAVDTKHMVDNLPEKMLLSLRPIQVEAMKAFLNISKGNGIVQLPTGKGKTILSLAIAHKLGLKTLILVHKDDLVVGWKKDIELCFGKEVKAGLIKARKKEIGDFITIATVQTLAKMRDKGELDDYLDKFGLVVQDECHRVGINIFNIIDRFCAPYKLGLSATPVRNDGLNFVFDLFFGGICYKYIAEKDDEDICNVKVRQLKSVFKYEPIILGNKVVNYYDYSPQELPENLLFIKDMPYEKRPQIHYMEIDDLAVMGSVHVVCSKIKEEYEKGHSIIALFTQKYHIDYFDLMLINPFYNIPENAIMKYYGDSKESSEAMMKKAENKEVLITLATYQKATEGTNVKAWEVMFLVSSLNNEKNVIQATGRIRRRKEGKIDPVIVYDVIYPEVYSLKNHYSTREKAYKELHYDIPEIKKSMFIRGYNK